MTALQQDVYLRQLFISEVTVDSPEMLVFIDETSTDHRNLVPKYGYSIRHKTHLLPQLTPYNGCEGVSWTLDLISIRFLDFLGLCLVFIPFMGVGS